MKRTPWGWGYCALGWCHRKHCMDKREEKISLPISKFRMQMSCDRVKEVQLKKWLTSARRQRSTHETQAEAFNGTCPQVLFISLNKS